MSDLLNFQRREVRFENDNRLEFDLKGKGRGNGYSFRLDDKNNPLLLCVEAEKNYQYCLDHPEEFETPGGEIRTNTYQSTYPSTGCCPECGEIVMLTDGLENFCDCGLCYNMSGDRVMSRSEWQEAGGESLAGERWDND